MSEVGPDSVTSLREVTAETLRAILGLRVRDEQRAFVADNAISIAEAYFDEGAWFRVIYADETPVGFLMIHDESLLEKPRERGYYFLWRLMVDSRYQRMGFGRRALLLLANHVRTRPDAERLLTSYHPGDDSPAGFYEGLGFRPTGQVDGDEVEMTIDLASLTETRAGETNGPRSGP